MSNSLSNGNSRSIIFGLVVVIAVVGALAYAYQQGEAIKKAKGRKGKSIVANEAAALPSKAKPSVEVEDDDEEEDDEEEEGEEDEKSKETRRLVEDEIKENKDKFDNCISVADKCVKGQDHARAIVKYSEALEVAPLVPSASNKIPSIYNNRSAMYEKLQQYSQSLNDIDVLLALDFTHIKARVRRARIFEAQEKHQEAMHEFCTAMLVERYKVPSSDSQANSQAHELKVAELSKKWAAKRAGPILDKIRNSPGRELPTNGYCRNFFDILPSTHKWRAQLSALKPSSFSSGPGDASAPGLAALTDALQLRQETHPGDTLRASLNAACCAIADGKFKLAFKSLAALKDEAAPTSTPSTPAPDDTPTPADTDADSSRTSDRSLRLYLSGLEKHLRCNLAGAVTDYHACMALDPVGANFECRLALASAHRELGEEGRAAELYADIFAGMAKRLGGAGKSAQGAGAGQEGEKGEQQEALKVLEEGKVDDSAPQSELEATDVHPMFNQFLRETQAGGLCSVSPQAVAAELSASQSPATAQALVDLAWSLVHRHSLWTMRTGAGEFRPHAVALSQQDLSLVDALLAPIEAGTPAAPPTKDVLHSATMCQVMHYIKHITLHTQTKASAAGPAYAMTDEEKLHCKECVTQAKRLAPTLESVMVLEADMLAMDERLEEALGVIDAIVKRADESDGVPYVIKANIVAQQVRMTVRVRVRVRVGVRVSVRVRVRVGLGLG